MTDSASYKHGELDDPVAIANQVLERPFADPDDDESILARQFLRANEARGAFKNFHRLLCERFGYGHDEKDWLRDQLSLIEHIAARSRGKTNPMNCGHLRLFECKGIPADEYVERQDCLFCEIDKPRPAVEPSVVPALPTGPLTPELLETARASCREAGLELAEPTADSIGVPSPSAICGCVGCNVRTEHFHYVVEASKEPNCDARGFPLAKPGIPIEARCAACHLPMVTTDDEYFTHDCDCMHKGAPR